MKKRINLHQIDDIAALNVINSSEDCIIDRKNLDIFSRFTWFKDDDGRIKTLVYIMAPQVMDLAETVYAIEHGASIDDIEPATDEDIDILLCELNRPGLND